MLLKQFLLTHTGSLYEQWLALVQDGNVHDCRRCFIELIAHLDNVSNELALESFINGLKCVY